MHNYPPRRRYPRPHPFAPSHGNDFARSQHTAGGNLFGALAERIVFAGFVVAASNAPNSAK